MAFNPLTMIWFLNILLIASSILSVFSQENESFSCVQIKENGLKKCLVANITLTTISPNYTQTNEDKDNVTIMDFRDGNIKELPEKLFLNYKNIIFMNINNCELTEITEESFKSAKKLLRLSISNTKLVNLKSNIFDECENLNFLDLSDNLIENISSDIFQPLANVKSIGLINNRIKIIEENVFSNLNLNVLLLSNNQIKEFNQNNLNIKYISLDNNLLNTLKIDNNSEIITAEDNQISRILVDETNALQKIKLGNNLLTDLRNISKLTKLKFLDLSENNILYTQEVFSDGLSQLVYLDISSNGKIDDLSFLKSLQSLEYLHVKQGSIINYNFKNILKIIPKIRSVTLQGTPWKMDLNPLFKTTINSLYRKGE